MADTKIWIVDGWQPRQKWVGQPTKIDNMGVWIGRKAPQTNPTVGINFRIARALHTPLFDQTIEPIGCQQTVPLEIVATLISNALVVDHTDIVGGVAQQR